MDIKIEIIREKRKTLSMRMDRDFRLLIRAPLWVPKARIDDFIDQKKKWIQDQVERIRDLNEAGKPFTEDEIKALKKQAKLIIPERVEKFSKMLKVTYGKITIRSQKSKWASCMGSGNLNFNCILAICPDEVIDYVVIHELCHRKHMDHSIRFWKMVEKYCPDYKKQKDWIKDEGKYILWRMQ